MTRISFLILSIILPFRLVGQLIITTPALPNDNKPVTINFDATQGTAGIKDFVGDVYAHTGVITDKSTSTSDWKYVKTQWGINTPETKLTRTGTNTYQLSISPDIRAYYNVPASEKILKMAFVFRSADATKQGKDTGGKDIFASVYETGLNVSFVNPSTVFSFVTENQSIDINIVATDNDSISLFLDNIRIKSAIGQSLTHTLLATGTEKHTLITKAYKNALIRVDTAYYLIPGTVVYASLPLGVRDGINYTDDQTVTLVLFAPYKNYTYAIGDFNGWMPDNLYLMKKDGDRFWITLSGLTSGKEYIFQYLIDGNLRIADPYTEKTSDPNDKYISSAIYPDLIKYPDNNTSEVASVFQTAQIPFVWQVTNFTPPAKEKLVIYELHIRDFTANHDMKTVTDTLSYLKRLGVNAIELMPISEFEGNDSWGYNPSFYFAPDKAYGTKNDYKKFIDMCHKNGIAVIHDIVLNHSYNQSPLVRMYFDGSKPMVQNPWYNQTSPNTTYSWGNDFNHESVYTKKLVDSIASFWMNEYKMDGFRYDFTKGFTNTPGDGWAYDASRIVILKRLATEIWKRNSNAYVIFEHLSDNSEETILANFGIMLWGNMNSKYNDATMGLNDAGKSDLSWNSYKNRGWNSPNLIGYMESHDEERLMFKNITFGNSSGSYNIKDLATALNRMKMAASFFYTIPGPKMLWQFGELGYDVSIDQGGRLGQKPIHWDYYSDANRRYLFEIHKALIQLKKDEPVFSTNNFSLNVSGSLKHIELLDASANVEIIGNFDVINKDYTLNFSSPGKWYDFFKGDSIILTGTSYPMTLKPGEFHLFSSKKLTNSGSILTSVKKLNEMDGISVYPNPFSTELLIEASVKLKEVEVYNLQGKKVLFKNITSDEIVNTSILPAGMYFITITTMAGEKKNLKISKI